MDSASSKLTMADMRSVLTALSVPVPANIRSAELKRLYDENVDAVLESQRPTIIDLDELPTGKNAEKKKEKEKTADENEKLPLQPEKLPSQPGKLPLQPEKGEMVSGSPAKSATGTIPKTVVTNQPPPLTMPVGQTLPKTNIPPAGVDELSDAPPHSANLSETENEYRELRLRRDILRLRKELRLLEIEEMAAAGTTAVASATSGMNTLDTLRPAVAARIASRMATAGPAVLAIRLRRPFLPKPCRLALLLP